MDAARAHPVRIAIVSFIVLALELALIRLVPAQVKAVSYFTNLILMASFFGLGLGCILRFRPRLQWLLPGGLLLILGLTLLGRGIVDYSSGQEIHFWLRRTAAPGQARLFPILAVALAAFGAATAPFVALGQRLAREMDRAPRLVAYGWDIAGSLLGTLTFAGAAALSLPPWLWFVVLLPVWALVFVEGWARRALFALSGLAFVATGHSPLASEWSPYYFIQHRLGPGPNGVEVYVNSSFHQQLVNFTASGTPELQQLLREKWGRPYALYRQIHSGRSPRRVLVLGAGTGNDVVIALEQGAEAVTAVEIDPRILALGRELNASRPYQDPRVRTVVDDARHFLRTSRDPFDLIVFGTLDSQALLSGYANLRLENYVYTRESLQDARRLLAEEGVAVVFYSVWKPWLSARLYTTFRAVFGDESTMHIDEDHTLFNTHLVGTKGVPRFRAAPELIARYGQGLVSTDDWPFIYLERRTIAPVYRQLVGCIAACVLLILFIFMKANPDNAFKLHFLLLGLGFTLIESSAVVRLALLFGATWVVNAVVFASVLLMIFCANLMVLKGRCPSLRTSWLALLLGLVVNYALPVSDLIVLPGPARVAAVALLIGWPVACASFCFSQLFAREGATGYALGINLVGAMAGGLVEYASMLVGMRAIWLIAVLLYAGAWASSRLRRG
jgi:SAM-dependent methyltransferase